MPRITIDRMDHVSDLGDVLTCAIFAQSPAESIWEEFYNSLDALSLATDSEWAAATAAARACFEENRAWIESQVQRDDCPEFTEEDSDFPLLFIMHGRRELLAGLPT